MSIKNRLRKEIRSYGEAYTRTINMDHGLMGVAVKSPDINLTMHYRGGVRMRNEQAYSLQQRKMLSTGNFAYGRVLVTDLYSIVHQLLHSVMYSCFSSASFAVMIADTTKNGGMPATG